MRRRSYKGLRSEGKINRKKSKVNFVPYLANRGQVGAVVEVGAESDRVIVHQLKLDPDAEVVSAAWKGAPKCPQ